MGKRIPEVDAYIERALPFAKPILKKLRSLFHKGCPQLNETIKWGAPHFEHHGLLLGCMASFKAHVGFGLWRGKELPDPTGLMAGKATTQLGALKLKSVVDLPPQQVILDLVAAAARLNEERAATPSKARAAAQPRKSASSVRAPADLAAALKRNQAAAATWAAFAYSHRRDYAEWLLEAKRPETRAKRLAQAVQWMAEGKSRNWKYTPSGK